MGRAREKVKGDHILICELYLGMVISKSEID
jgi:hypothetical protein